MTDLAKFSIETMITGQSKVTINGVDESEKVAALSYESRPGQFPILTLRLVGDGMIEGQGIVRVSADLPDAEIILEFLDSVDVRELEAAALNGGMRESPIAAALRILRERASGY